jgi:hypothetical protein
MEKREKIVFYEIRKSKGIFQKIIFEDIPSAQGGGARND